MLGFRVRITDRMVVTVVASLATFSVLSVLINYTLPEWLTGAGVVILSSISLRIVLDNLFS